ncbi:MAG: putative lipid II flippase FtsW [Candidatus Omnitrophica bacterium]|nr:putative lipid II flippase FtsW [Candidatus Omnitrophota bacterium]
MSLSKEGNAVFIATLVLNAVGTIMIFSASAVFADKYMDDSLYFLKRQIVYLVLGFSALLAASSINLNWIQKHSRVILLLSIFFLILVFMPVIGKSGGGARRWIGFPGFNFQPVEFAKLAVAIYLSDYLSRKMKWIQSGSLVVYLVPGLMLLLLFGVTILQPDLGSVVFIFLLSSILLFLSGIPLRYVGAVFLAALPIFAMAVFHSSYRMARILAFLNPWADPLGTGFQIIQSFLAFALGGLTGVGLGESVQKLFYLPQSYTDFIFSIIGEETGLAGTLFVLLVFVFLVLQGLRIAKRVQDDPFRQLLAFATVSIIAFQAIINMLVTTGMIPTKGLPLPFISYGGSAIIGNMAAIGLLLAIDKEYMKREVYEQT